MAKQHLYQNSGVLIGSIIAGILFDIDLNYRSSHLSWAALATLTFVVFIILVIKNIYPVKQADNI